MLPHQHQQPQLRRQHQHSHLVNHQMQQQQQQQQHHHHHQHQHQQQGWDMPMASSSSSSSSSFPPSYFHSLNPSPVSSPSCPIHPPHPLKTSIFPPAATCPPECSYASCTDPTRSTRINTFNSSDRSMLSLLPFGVVVVRMNYHGCTTSTANSLPPQYSAASLVNASRPVFANPTFSSAFRLPDSTSLTIDAVCSQIAQTIHPDDWRTISTTLFPFHPSASSTEMPPPSLSSLPFTTSQPNLISYRILQPNNTYRQVSGHSFFVPQPQNASQIFVHIVKIDDSTKSSSADPPVHHPTSNHHNQHPFKPPSSLSSTLPATLPETMSLHDLTDMICHEIRNPLAGISGNLELLRHGLEQRRAVLARALGLKSDPSPTPPMQHLHALHRDDEECVEAIQVCSKHAGRIVSDVQNLHAHDGETQRSGMAHGLFDPRTVVGEVARMMRARARIAGVGLRTCFPLDRVELWGDAQRVRQVVVNLVLNAVGHTASGGTITVGVEPMVSGSGEGGESAKESREEERSGEDEMRAKHMAVIRRRLGMKPVAVQGAAPPPFREGGERRDVVAKDSLGGSATQVIKIYVTDTGTGMTPEECDKLFKRFSQPIKKNQKEGVVVDEGFGLGLQISRRLVESMGGRMGVQSVKGRGSTFFFLLGGRPITPDDADGGITLSTPATVESHTRPVPLSRRARTLTHDESVLSSTKAVACVPLRRARSVSADGEGCVPLNVDPFPVIPPSNGGGIMMTTDVAWDTPPPTPRNGPVMGERMRTLSGTMMGDVMSCEETREEESGEVLKKGRLPKALMIVEDNPINQRILTRFLASLGIPTVTARDGLEALELLYHRVDDTTPDPTPTPPLTLGGTLIAPPPAYPTPSRPHDSTKRIRRRTGMEDVEIVFMDVEMPRMDGITATREIRRLEREEEGGGRKRKFGEDEDGVEEEGGGGEKRRRLMIVGLSGNARSDHVRSGLEAGMDEYVIKPWKAEDIERVCRTAE